MEAVLRSPFLVAGPVVEEFEKAFAAYLGRRYAIAVPSGTSGSRSFCWRRASVPATK